MNWTPSKIVALVLATSVLTAVCTCLLIRRALLSSGGFISSPGKVAMSRQGAVMRQGSGSTWQWQWPSPDPKAMADLDKKVKDRQDTDETANATPINLKPYVNCKLTDPLADNPDQMDHTLADLPTGLHSYGGVPFDVAGIVQLTGASIQNGNENWPAEVKGIPIGHSFKKLHLLHGAFNIVAPQANITFAKLVLHYADGSQQEFGLAGGEQALRCVDAAVPEELDILQGHQTELAWFAANPYLKKNNPGAAVHLYRTTFDNPKPDAQVTTIDYVSATANPGPFMVGLTIE